MDILLTGLTGLQAHQRAIEVTSHNIANATTPGYSKQRVELATVSPEIIPEGMLGRGVTVDSIRRIANDLIIERLRQSQSESGRLQYLSDSLKTAELTFNEPGDNGLSAMINKLFASFEDLSNNPESSALRTTVVQQLGAFTDTMNAIGRSLRQQREDITSSIQGEVNEVNQLTSEIAVLNQQIREQVLRGAAPNDLIDRREQLINQLSGKMELRALADGTDGTIRISSGGILLVGTEYAEKLSVGETASGDVTLLLTNGTEVGITGGSIGALMDLHGTILPQLISDTDALAITLAGELNARQSTGTNHTSHITSFVSDYAVDALSSSVNLDDASQTQLVTNGLGIPKAFLPSFTDSSGVEIARNLTINVYDPASGTAQKYIVRYDPATAGGTRSLDDLVSVINSGRSTASGGFTLYPPSYNGIPNVTARKVIVDGGARLELTAQNGRSLDFSRALDLAPASNAWTGPVTTITGSDAALANQRLMIRVNGNNLEAYVRNNATGTESLYGQLPVAGLPGALGGLTITAGAGTFNDGETFSVDFDLNGAISGGSGSYVQSTQWNAGDASFMVRGRYTGAVTYQPGREWSMRVITPGTVGDRNNPPMVEFTYYTGPADAPVQEKVQKVLDHSLPAGSPVTIADGVYVTFAAGSLTSAGNQASWIVDAEPDQARLLPALGINGLFQGTSAETLVVSESLRKDPVRLAVATTRAAGDNSNLLNMVSARSDKLFSNGSSSVEDFYHTTIAGLGIQVSQAARKQDNQETLRTSLENQRQQVSGVSIDEEVSYLILQQQAYTAAARLITTARENIQTLLELVR
jgi:flagellar hook-associated protein FlgK